jgi:integral membrane sensor domain MASE1
LIFYRGVLSKRGIDPLGRDILKSGKAAFWFVIWVMGITNIIGGLWAVWNLTLLGFVPHNAFWLGASLWIIGDAVVLLIAPFLITFLTPIVRRYGLLTKGWVS